MNGGRALTGALLSVACQFAAFVVLMVVGVGWLGMLWSIPQWCIVIPLFRDLKRRQQGRTAQALLITSYLGTALNAGFIWLVFDSINHPHY